MKNILILASSLILLASCSSRSQRDAEARAAKSAYVVIQHNSKALSFEVLSTDLPPYGVSKFTVDSITYILTSNRHGITIVKHK